MTFPPQAVPTDQNVAVEQLDEVPVQIVADVVMLDQFSLTATDSGGKHLARFDAAWSADFGFGACTSEEGCLWDVVDQSTIRCMYLDETTSEWQPLDSRTDVIGDRLYCTSAFAGAFAIVGEFPETSDTGSGRAIFLPAVLR